MKPRIAPILIFVFLLLATAGVAQTAPDGTYQFLYRTDSASAAITLTAAELTQIEQLRKSSEPVYIYYNENVVIKILPFDKIQDPDFTPPAASSLHEDTELRVNRYKIRKFSDNSSK